jgi:hypothetical protein
LHHQENGGSDASVFVWMNGPIFRSRASVNTRLNQAMRKAACALAQHPEKLGYVLAHRALVAMRMRSTAIGESENVAVACALTGYDAAGPEPEIL